MVLSAPGDPDRSAGAEGAVAQAIEELMSWAAGLTLDDIPEPVRRRAALVLCDDLAAMVAACAEPEVVALQEQLLATSGAAPGLPSSSHATRGRCSRPNHISLPTR